MPDTRTNRLNADLERANALLRQTVQVLAELDGDTVETLALQHRIDLHLIGDPTPPVWDRHDVRAIESHLVEVGDFGISVTAEEALRRALPFLADPEERETLADAFHERAERRKAGKGKHRPFASPWVTLRDRIQDVVLSNREYEKVYENSMPGAAAQGRSSAETAEKIGKWVEELGESPETRQVRHQLESWSEADYDVVWGALVKAWDAGNQSEGLDSPALAASVLDRLIRTGSAKPLAYRAICDAWCDGYIRAPGLTDEQAQAFVKQYARDVVQQAGGEEVEIGQIIDISKTEREPGWYAEPLMDDYGTTKVTVKPSSAADRDACWLRLEGDAHVLKGEEIVIYSPAVPKYDIAATRIVKAFNSAHLTVDLAKDVRDRLDAWLEAVKA